MYKLTTDRITEENITALKDNEVFVFGSNESGRHGLGAAKTALKWGAQYGAAEGLQGQTYAIPTVDKWVKNKLSLSEIAAYVDSFLQYATQHSEKNFLVTAIGTGLAGWTVQDIAPLFEEAIMIDNVALPQSFWDILLA
jgi:hypothetical protein